MDPNFQGQCGIVDLLSWANAKKFFEPQGYFRTFFSNKNNSSWLTKMDIKKSHLDHWWSSTYPQFFGGKMTSVRGRSDMRHIICLCLCVLVDHTLKICQQEINKIFFRRFRNFNPFHKNNESRKTKIYFVLHPPMTLTLSPMIIARCSHPALL